MNSVKTSATHPICVDWIAENLPGKIGLTFAPGKQAIARYEGGRWERDLAIDLDRLVQVYGMGMQVCLLEDHELALLRIPRLIEAATSRGVQVLRLPIRDGGILPELEPVRSVVEQIIGAARAGRNVIVHCAGGLGRAGTVGGCVLVRLGKSTEEAFLLLREARGPNCPETEAQRDFIRQFARDPQTPSPSTRENRIAGCVIGAAVGDAMGHPTEFLTMSAIHRKFGPEGVIGYQLYWERDGKRFAPYTDDTQMAEVVLRTLIESGTLKLTLDDTMQRMARGFIEWADHPQGGHGAPGNACLAGCRALKAGVPWHEAGDAKAGGCGSVMRAYPFGLAFAGNVDQAERWSVAHSELTHRDPIALAACAAMARGQSSGWTHFKFREGWPGSERPRSCELSPG